MSFLMRRIWRGLTGNVAATSPDSDDPRLRGRTYSIPFEQVWQAALFLADGGLARWNVLEADDYNGIIRAESRTLVFRFIDDVTIRIVLDENAQTRVDARSASRKGRGDLGANARRLSKFFRRLDRALTRHMRKPVAPPPGVR